MFSKLPRQTRWAALALAGLALFMVWDQHFWWKLSDEYAFGFIVPLFVAYVLFDRWPRISRLLSGAAEGAGKEDMGAGQTDSGGRASRRSKLSTGLSEAASLLMVLGGMGAFFLGALYRAVEGQNLITSNLIAFGFANLLLGSVFLYGEGRADGLRNSLRERFELALLFLFPALIWLLSVPMFSALDRTVSTFLMNQVAIVVYHSFDLLGFAVIREGSVLKLPLGDVGIEDACSGIRSLTACLFAGSFLGAVYFEAFWKKSLLVFTAMLFAFINNIGRSLFLTSWAYSQGPEGLDNHIVLGGVNLGSIHDFTGWVVLGITVLCLLALVKLFRLRLEYPLEEPLHSL